MGAWSDSTWKTREGAGLRSPTCRSDFGARNEGTRSSGRLLPGVNQAQRRPVALWGVSGQSSRGEGFCLQAAPASGPLGAGPSPAGGTPHSLAGRTRLHGVPSPSPQRKAGVHRSDGAREGLGEHSTGPSPGTRRRKSGARGARTGRGAGPWPRTPANPRPAPRGPGRPAPPRRSPGRVPQPRAEARRKASVPPEPPRPAGPAGSRRSGRNAARGGRAGAAA